MPIMESVSIQEIFYYHQLMPCCGKTRLYQEGPRGGESLNIKCAHCGQTWNICPDARFIEHI